MIELEMCQLMGDSESKLTLVFDFRYQSYINNKCSIQIAKRIYFRILENKDSLGRMVQHVISQYPLQDAFSKSLQRIVLDKRLLFYFTNQIVGFFQIDVADLRLLAGVNS